MSLRCALVGVAVMGASWMSAGSAKADAASPVQTSANRTVVIRAQSLIDGASDRPRSHVDIVIRGNRISEILQSGAHPLPAGAEIIDLGSATLLPGLIDTHTHIFLQGEDPAAGGYDVQLLKYPAAYRAARAVVSARRALEQGFTSIRDMETEGAGYGDVGIKQAINEGIIPGPRMWVTTVSISSTGGYPLEGYAPEIVVPKGSLNRRSLSRNSRRSSTRRMGGARKSPATLTTARGCSAPWMAAAIRSSTAWGLRTHRSGKW